MEAIYHEIITAIYKDRIYAERTLQLGLSSGSGDYIAEILINLDDGTCTYIELIPILEKISSVEWFIHDENFVPTEWEHDPDPNAKKSFREWALKGIENLNKNAQSLSSSTEIHRALTSNSVHLIRTTLDLLASDSRVKDKKLIPILEKIALKDAYKSYFSGIGYQTDCHLSELANSVIQMINKNTKRDDERLNRVLELPHELAGSKVQTIDKVASDIDEKNGDFFIRSCSTCGSLPDDITANTGRDFRLPDEINKLEYKGVGSSPNIHMYRCPVCGTYYERIIVPQVYGSGNLDEERLVRLSWNRSLIVDKWF